MWGCGRAVTKHPVIFAWPRCRQHPRGRRIAGGAEGEPERPVEGPAASWGPSGACSRRDNPSMGRPSGVAKFGFSSVKQCCGSGSLWSRRTYVFGPPGSFDHQAKIVRKKTLISTVLWLLYDFLPLFSIRKLRIRMILGLPDPHPDPVDRGTDPRIRMSRIQNTSVSSLKKILEMWDFVIVR